MARSNAQWPQIEKLVTRVVPLGGDRFELHLDGPLAPGWAGNLAAGLARAGVSIDRGHARGAGAGLWTARIELTRAPGGSDPSSLDPGQLACTDSGAGFATPIELDHFSLEASLDHGGSLQLLIGAPDSVGFLSALLRRFAYFALFPVEFRLETQGTRVADELWFQAGGSRPPSTTTAIAVRSALQSLVRKR